MNKAMWSVWNKPEAREIAKEMFEEKRANEDELKKRKRELKKISNEWERLRDKKTFEELSGEEKKQFELLESVLEDYATPEEISKIQRLIDQASKVINEIDSSKVKSSRDEMIEMYARSIVDALQEVLSSGSDKDIKDAAKVCEEVTRDYGVLSYQEFYNSGAEIKTTIISAIYEALY